MSNKWAPVNRMIQFLLSAGSVVIYNKKKMLVESVDRGKFRITCRYKNRLIRDIPMDSVTLESVKSE